MDKKGKHFIYQATMSKQRKNRSAKEKFTVAVEFIMWRKTQAQITAEYGVHPTQQKQWKDELLQRWASVFENKKHDEEKEKKKEVERLKTIIGQYAVEVDWLQKKIGLL